MAFTAARLSCSCLVDQMRAAYFRLAAPEWTEQKVPDLLDLDGLDFLDNAMGSTMPALAGLDRRGKKCREQNRDDG